MLVSYCSGVCSGVCFDNCGRVDFDLRIIYIYYIYLFPIIFLSDDTECGEGLVCYQRSADEEVPFCYGVALEMRDYCSFPLRGTSPAATVTGSASIMAATTAVVIGIAFMFA